VGLVDRRGSIDWWCAPRIDSGAVFAALLGTPDHGRWLIRPKGKVRAISRRYESETLVLETVFDTATGQVAVSDFMPPGQTAPTIHRIVEGRAGVVTMDMELIVRFEYGAITPWVTGTGDGLLMVAGSDGLRFHSPVPLKGKNHKTVASFEVSEGARRSFSLAWFPAASSAPLPLDSLAARNHARQWWRQWVGRCTYDGEWRDDVIRSLITLKALTYEPTGAVCAAATTSLPESLGGVRNWDYRYSWLRDATLTLQALLISGYAGEAAAWAHWLRRAVAGNPGELQIMYGVGGERRLTEFELDYLPGYEKSSPVRVGNQASTQLQLDVFGEVMDSALTSTRHSLPREVDWDPDLILAILAHLESI
jgi:GH15 family glucan-1,4-alpha-glucosidase